MKVPSTMRENGRIPVNGIHIYYEVHGRADGIPLVLLPGGGSTIETTFGRVLPALAASRRVIALEEQGHGHGDYLGEIVAAPNATRYPELTAGLIEEFLAPS